MNLEVVLVNDSGVVVVEGICCKPIHKIALMKLCLAPRTLELSY